MNKGVIKLRQIFLTFLVAILLTACGSGDSGSSGSTSQNVKKMETHGDYDLENEPSSARIVNELIADDDDFKVVIISVRHTDTGPSKGQNHAKIYFENKTDQEVSVQGKDVVVDGVEMPEYDLYTVLYEQENDTEILSTYDFDGDLPQMEESLSFIININDFDSHDELATYEVNLEF